MRVKIYSRGAIRGKIFSRGEIRVKIFSRGEMRGEIFRKAKFEKALIKTKTKTETKRGKTPTGGALRAPRAGSPAFVSGFVFVLIFGFSNFDFPQCLYRLL